MPLLNLPPELPALIADNVRNIEDFTNFSSTCRTLHTLLPQMTGPNTILNLCARSAPIFFSPHPHFLIAASSRRLSEVVLGNVALTEKLVEAFRSGIDGPYQFCLAHSGLTLPEIRRWHLARFSTINPLVDLIDKLAGRQWYDTPNFWNSGVSEAETLQAEPQRASLQIIIYGELFGSSLWRFLEPDPRPSSCYFTHNVRLEYIKYCIPTWESFGGDDDLPAVFHILFYGRWRRAWRAVLRQIGPDFWDEEPFEDGELHTTGRQYWTMRTAPQRRQLLWWNGAVQTGGLEGAEAITTLDAAGQLSPGPRERLTALRRKIEALSDEYVLSIGSIVLGIETYPETISEVPDFGKEAGATLTDLWPVPGNA